MHPVICTIGPFTVYSYGLMVVAGFLLALFLAKRQAPKYGIDPQLLSNLCFLLLVSGVLGARIFYVALHFSLFRDNPFEIFLLNRGGLSWFGGLFFAAAGSVFYLRKKKAGVFLHLDFLAPYIALAQAVGRIGCFLNGCCFGYPSDNGVYFPVHGARLVPVQLYSALSLFVIFLLLRSFQGRMLKRGSLFSLYLLFASAERFLSEFLRAEERLFFAGLSIFQWICAGIFLASLIALVAIKLNRQK
ncbi:MAG: prolipoprotein diacylglyceryl transferase [Candidatus Omnitrophica bacterium]|nr:prolipoprotein diacylglyceryl transferase [Candidatus Omnitrophota bacterium]